MQSGDGLLVRIRPHGGRIDAEQASGIADLAERYGNGLIDLTIRANLQIRGISADNHLSVIEELARYRLLDPDQESESRRNVIVTPFWTEDDETISIANELEHALAKSPADLPIKFGFAVDSGNERALADASADIRIERGIDGQLIVRVDAAELGHRVTRRKAVASAISLAEWFVASGGVKAGRGRMAAHIAAGAKPPESLCGNASPAPQSAPPEPGLTFHGALFAVAFGQLTDTMLRWLADNADGLRLTPWRMILAEGMHDMPAREGLITKTDDPLLRVVACSGAPRCQEAHADTRSFAAALALHLPDNARLHVSGCAKGCAQSRPASITLVATPLGFDLIRNGSTHDTPMFRDLSKESLIARPLFLSGDADAA
jgi:precorrin-3B synthase